MSLVQAVNAENQRMTQQNERMTQENQRMMHSITQMEPKLNLNVRKEKGGRWAPRSTLVECVHTQFTPRATTRGHGQNEKVQRGGWRDDN